MIKILCKVKLLNIKFENYSKKIYFKLAFLFYKIRKMKLLIFVSSQLEIKSILTFFNVEWNENQRSASVEINENVIDFYYSDPGIFSLSYYLTNCLCSGSYDLVINAGIAGCFNVNINVGELLVVKKDRFVDIGVIESMVFKDLFDMGLIKKNAFPFKEGWLMDNPGEYSLLVNSLKEVNAVTVNIVSSLEEQIADIKKNYNPDIESMEGAAFFYVCGMKKVNCLQLRAVSNLVGERDKSKWDLSGSLHCLGEGIKKMVYEL